MDLRILILTSAPPRSILVLSGRYHTMSNASIVNNCIISDHCSFRGGLTGKVSLQFQYFGASPGLVSGMYATCLTRRNIEQDMESSFFLNVHFFYFCFLALQDLQTIYYHLPDHPFIVVQIMQFISSIAQVLPLVTQEALISFNCDY